MAGNSAERSEAESGGTGGRHAPRRRPRGSRVAREARLRKGVAGGISPPASARATGAASRQGEARRRADAPQRERKGRRRRGARQEAPRPGDRRSAGHGAAEAQANAGGDWRAGAQTPRDPQTEAPHGRAGNGRTTRSGTTGGGARLKHESERGEPRHSKKPAATNASHGRAKRGVTRAGEARPPGAPWKCPGCDTVLS